MRLAAVRRTALWLNRPPEVMAQQAQDFLERLCHTDPPADRTWRYQYDAGYLRHVRDTDPSPGRWDGLRTQQPTAVIFFYRQSPRPLLAFASSMPGDDLSSVSALAPPPVVPGMAGVELDGQGRLLSLYVISPEHDTTKPGPPPGWARRFTAAGLAISQCRPADPEWNSLVDADVLRSDTPTRLQGSPLASRQATCPSCPLRRRQPDGRPRRPRPEKWQNTGVDHFVLGHGKTDFTPFFPG
jgi:hypothetical protein